MAVALRATSTANRTTAQAPSITAPTVQAGDLVIISYIGTPTNIAFSGFQSQSVAVGTNTHYLFYKIAGNSEPATYTGTGTSATYSIVAATYSGVDQTTPISSVNQAGGTGTSFPLPVLTSNSDGSMLVALVSHLNSNAMTAPSGYTREQTSGSTTTANRVSIVDSGATTYTIGSSNASGNVTATGSAAYNVFGFMVNAPLPTGLYYKGAGTAGTAGATSLACNYPSNAVQGDFLLLSVATGNTGYTLTPSSGWTAIDTTDSNGQFYWRYADIETSVTVTASGSIPIYMIVAAYAGVDSTTPFSDKLYSTGTSINSDSSGNYTFGPLSTSKDGELAVALIAGATLGSSISVSSGWTFEKYSGTNGSGTALAHQKISTAGSTGTVTFTASNALSGFGAECNIIALNPSGAGSSISPTFISSAQSFGSVSLSYDQTISTTGNSITSSEHFGTDTVVANYTVDETGNAISTTETFYGPTLIASYVIQPTAPPSAESFGSDSVTTSTLITISGNIPSSEYFGSASVSQSANDQTIDETGNAIASSEVFYSPATVLQSSVQAQSISSSESFGSATLIEDQFVSPSVISSSETFYTLSINTLGGITPNTILSAESFGAVSLSTAYSVDETGNAIPSAEQFGTASLDQSSNITVTGIGSSEAFGTAGIIIAGSVAVPSISSGEQFGTANLITSTTITVAGINSSEAFGSASISNAISPVSIGTAESFGSASLSNVSTIASTQIPTSESFGSTNVIADQKVSVTGIATSESFGSVTVSLTTGIVVSSVDSLEAFGSTTITTSYEIATTTIPSSESYGSVIAAVESLIAPDPIVGEEAFWLATINSDISITASQIPPSSSYGSASVTSSNGIAATQIVTSEAFGTARLTTSSQIAPVSFISQEVFGPTSVLGQNSVSPVAIISVESAGLVSVTAGTAYIAPLSVPSEESFGYSTLGTAGEISAQHISSQESFGRTIAASEYSIAPESVASGEWFGTASISTSTTIAVPQIISRFYVYPPKVGNTWVISTDYINSEEGLFSLSVQLGGTEINATLIDPSETYGQVTVISTPVISLQGDIRAVELVKINENAVTIPSVQEGSDAYVIHSGSTTATPVTVSSNIYKISTGSAPFKLRK